MLYYVFFCLTTAICAIYEILYPVMQAQALIAPIDNAWLIYILVFIGCLIIAPVAFYASIVPSSGIKFRDALSKGLFSKD